MKIEKVKIGDIIPYENNAKLHPQEQIEQIKSSIEAFGNNDPIAIDQNNVIIEGHGRLMALEQLGYTEVECIRLSHLTEEQRKAYTLVHNKLTMNTDFDMELLEQELETIINFDMDELGFDDLGFDTDIEDINEDDFNEDEVEVVEAKTAVGEIWQLGDHILMCGDSTNKEHGEALMDGAQADLVVTDPPYNVNYQGGTSDKLTIQNDHMSEASFIAFLTDAFAVMEKALKKGGSFYIWHAESTRYEFLKGLVANNLTVRQALIWVKNTIVLGRQDYQWKHEPVLYGWKDGEAHYFTIDRTQSTVIEDKPNLNRMDKDQLKDYAKELQAIIDSGTSIIREDKPSRNAEHPTMKPVKLIAKNILNSSREGEIVLDLFGGSGTTLIACEQTNRKCRMMEFDPKYCDVIINRWEQFTGKKAKKIK